MTNTKNIFYTYSKTLCGSHRISKKVSSLYFDLLYVEYDDEFLDFLKKVENGYGSSLEDKTIHQFQSIILYLWFTSELIQKNEVAEFLNSLNSKFRKKQEYFTPSPIGYYSAIMWSSIKAHPLGLTGGYFGHWKYLPE